MPGLDEIIGAKTQLGGDLAAGVTTLSLDQQVVFTRYVRVVLPLDGFVFWLRADQVSPSTVFNAMQPNSARFDAAKFTVPAATLTVQGSLHYATQTRQVEEENYAANRVVFTTLGPVNDLNQVGGNYLWIADFHGLKVAFSDRGSFYEQADLYHYVGYAVFPDMASQVVDDVAKLDRQLVCSNSLPLWLALNNYSSFYGFANNIPLYPSFLVPQNIVPPWGAVHIDPAGTMAIGGAPRLDRMTNHTQLVQDRVKITFYGVNNAGALDFVDCVLQRSDDYGEFGVMNQPVIRDEKREQSELGTLAMKKSVLFDVNYYQHRVLDVARQLILSAVPTINVACFRGS